MAAAAVVVPQRRAREKVKRDSGTADGGFVVMIFCNQFN